MLDLNSGGADIGILVQLILGIAVGVLVLIIIVIVIVLCVRKRRRAAAGDRRVLILFNNIQHDL